MYIWMNAYKASLDLPSPIDNGWILKNGKLEQHLIFQIPAPRKVAEFVLCRCKKNCKINNCSCRKSKLVYTEVCLCDNCEIRLATVKVTQIQKRLNSFYSNLSAILNLRKLSVKSIPKIKKLFLFLKTDDKAAVLIFMLVLQP